MSRLLGGSGMEFDSKENTRDVFMKIESDSGCLKLAEMLGWKEDLDKLIKS